MNTDNTNGKLNDRQAEAAHHPGGPLLIAAGAGSGKTHTLTTRLRYLLDGLRVPPERILAITFTNKAAEEMRRRAGTPPELFIGTFHSFGARLLRAEARRLGRNAGFTIFDEDDAQSLMKRVTRERNLPKETCAPTTLLRAVSALKNDLKEPNGIGSSAIGNIEPETLRAVWDDYEDALRANNAFDFDDLIQKPALLFARNADILSKYQSRYDHILIDEFQDTNGAQYALVKALAADHRNLSVVGDDAQSIYAFRGADFRNFLDFERDWPDTKTVLLEENYRSTPVILAAANAIIKNNAVQKRKNLWTKNPGAEPVRVYKADDEDDEAEWIVKTAISRMRAGDRESDIAVLYRTNAQSRAIEQALIAAGIAYRIFGGIRFYERKEIKDIVAGLRCAANPADTVASERIAKNFSKGKAVSLMASLPHMGSRAPADIVAHFIETTGYLDYLKNNYKNAEDRIENVQGLMSFARQFSENNLAGFLEAATLTQSQDALQGNTGMNLMSIHMSKGLEFGTVFIAGATEGLLPHHRAYANDSEMEEERRLMYVAVTRAKHRLYASFAATPSRFLYEIDGDLVEFVNAAIPGTRTRLETKRPLPNEDDMWLEYD